MGSSSELRSLITDSESAYIFGLFRADGYYRSSSVGLSNIDSRLIERFAAYLRRLFPADRLKWHVYYPPGKRPDGMRVPMTAVRKAKHIAYHLYVNSRPLLRQFQMAEQQTISLPKKYILAYFAGRFDGDGSVDKNLRSDLRIVYSNEAEAVCDRKLLEKLGRYKTRLYHYRSARTYVVYFSRYDAPTFLRDIAPYSVIASSLLPRRDLAV